MGDRLVFDVHHPVPGDAGRGVEIALRDCDKKSVGLEIRGAKPEIRIEHHLLARRTPGGSRTFRGRHRAFRRRRRARGRLFHRRRQRLGLHLGIREMHREIEVELVAG
jgi:hypothetical protein